MSEPIYIVSTEELSGKTVVAVSLALLSKDSGKKTGYFKPIGFESAATDGREEAHDEDAETMREVLGLKGETALICPLILSRDDFLEGFGGADVSKSADKIAAAYRKASEGKEAMLIEGPPKLSVGSFLGCAAPKLAAMFGAKVLLVIRLDDDFVFDEVLQARDCFLRWNVALSGVILNRIPAGRMERAAKVVKPLFEKSGVKVFGLIHEDRMLSSLKVSEIYEVVGGRVLAGMEGMDKIVQTFLVGAMTPESATRYFQKAKNELVITGGDRTDIIFAAMEAGAAALILTGNLHPSVKIFPRADDLSIPIILVPYDTYTTLQMIQRIVGRIKSRDKARINRAKKLFSEHVNWREILSDSSSG